MPARQAQRTFTEARDRHRGVLRGSVRRAGVSSWLCGEARQIDDQQLRVHLLRQSPANGADGLLLRGAPTHGGRWTQSPHRLLPRPDCIPGVLQRSTIHPGSWV